MPKSDILTPRQGRFVAALWTCKTIAEAAKAAGISERTGLRWVHLPAVQDALRQEQQGALAEVTRQSVKAMTGALGVLVDVTTAPDAPWAARVSAARAILESGLRFTETIDLEARVSKLENAEGEK